MRTLQDTHTQIHGMYILSRILYIGSTVAIERQPEKQEQQNKKKNERKKRNNTNLKQHTAFRSSGCLGSVWQRRIGPAANIFHSVNPAILLSIRVHTERHTERTAQRGMGPGPGPASAHNIMSNP